MSKQDLISLARRGDEAAWETLVRQHQEVTFRLAFLLLGDADEAADVTQEAFIRAFQAMHRFDATRPFRPWLLSIAANLARNRLRSIGRYLAALRRALWANPDPADAGTDNAQAQIVWQAVRRLDAADQQVIYLRYFLELSEAEMAMTLDVAPGTVKSRLHRAVQRLKVAANEFPTLREEWGNE